MSTTRKPFSKEQKKEVRKIAKSAARADLEVKFWNTAITEFSVTSVGSNIAFSDIAQGLLDSNRIGDEIKPIHLRVEGLASAGDIRSTLRIILYQYLALVDTGVAQPTYKDILNDLYDQTEYATLSPRNMDKKSLFHILADRTLTLSPGNGQKRFSFDKKVNLRKINYVDASATNCTGRVLCLIVSDNTTAVAGDQPRFKFISTLQFVDP